jgi:hypothetical protein
MPNPAMVDAGAATAATHTRQLQTAAQRAVAAASHSRWDLAQGEWAQGRIATPATRVASTLGKALLRRTLLGAASAYGV